MADRVPARPAKGWPDEEGVSWFVAISGDVLIHEREWYHEGGKVYTYREAEPIARRLAYAPIEEAAVTTRMVALERRWEQPRVPVGTAPPEPPDAWQIIVTETVRSRA